MTQKTAVTALIEAVAIVVVVIGGYRAFVQQAPRSGNVAPTEGSVGQSDREGALTSLKNAIEAAGGASFDFEPQSTYGRYANFGIVRQVNEVKSVGIVDEMAITFRGKTDNEFAEVDPKTNQVISFHREVDYNSTAPEKSQAEIEASVRAFLAKVYPNFAQVESTLTFENNSKTGRPEGSNYFFTWNDLGYANELPEGVETERAPFIQVGITSSGFIFSYNNTVDLYRNALKEFGVTQSL